MTLFSDFPAVSLPSHFPAGAHDQKPLESRKVPLETGDRKAGKRRAPWRRAGGARTSRKLGNSETRKVSMKEGHGSFWKEVDSYFRKKVRKIDQLQRKLLETRCNWTGLSGRKAGKSESRKVGKSAKVERGSNRNVINKSTFRPSDDARTRPETWKLRVRSLSQRRGSTSPTWCRRPTRKQYASNHPPLPPPGRGGRGRLRRG